MSTRSRRILLGALACGLALTLAACGLSPLPDLPSGRDRGEDVNGDGSGGAASGSGGSLNGPPGTGGTLVVDEPAEGGFGGQGGLGGRSLE